MIAKGSKETMQSLLDRMCPALLLAGCPKHQIRIRSGLHRIKTLADAFDWLHNFYLSEVYQEFIRVYNLVPPQTWRRYTLFGIEGLREQELLADASRALWTAWRTSRPSLFNKDKKSNDKDHKKSNSCVTQRGSFHTV